MKTRNLLYTLLVIGGMLMASWVLYPTGSPGGKTGSPGDGGSNCTGCHSGSAQQGSGWITSNIPAGGYVPGQTYTITATGTHTGVGKFGFETTAEDLAGVKEGTITITDASQTQLANAGKSITHTVNGTTPSGDSKSWSFDWTAPASGTGVISFYGAFNAANGNGNNTGDVIYLSSYSVSEASTGIGDNIAGIVDVKVFPNPFTTYIVVELGSMKDEAREIRLVSLTGAVVYAEKVSNQVSAKIYRISTGDLSNGVYHLGVIFRDGSQADYAVIKK